MSLFICKNTTCVESKKEVEVPRVSWKWREGKLQHEIKCKCCGELMEYIQPKFEGLSESQIAKIGSWTDSQKKEYFKKNNIKPY